MLLPKEIIQYIFNFIDDTDSTIPEYTRIIESSLKLWNSNMMYNHTYHRELLKIEQYSPRDLPYYIQYSSHNYDYNCGCIECSIKRKHEHKFGLYHIKKKTAKYVAQNIINEKVQHYTNLLDTANKFILLYENAQNA